MAGGSVDWNNTYGFEVARKPHRGECGQVVLLDHGDERRISYSNLPCPADTTDCCCPFILGNSE